MTSSTDTQIADDLRIFVDAMEMALPAISPEKAREFAAIDRTDVLAIAAFWASLNALPPDAQQIVQARVRTAVDNERMSRIAAAAEQAIRATWPKWTPRSLRLKEPILFDLIVSSLPLAMGEALAQQATAAQPDGSIGIELANGVNDIYVNFSGEWPGKLYGFYGEKPSGDIAEFRVNIELRQCGDLRGLYEDSGDEAVVDGVTGLRPAWVLPLRMYGPNPNSKLAQFRFERAVTPSSRVDSEKPGVPSLDEARDLHGKIKSRLHADGLTEIERAGVEASRLRRSHLFRRQKIYPSDGARSTAPSLEQVVASLREKLALPAAQLGSENIVEQGLLGLGGWQRLLNDRRAERFVECLDKCCDDFPGVDLADGLATVEVWRTPLPFYDFHDLYELVDYRHGDVRRSFFLYGDDNRVAYPAELEPWRLQPLSGQADHIHEVNNFIGVDTSTPDLAAEYIRFFCSYLIGDIESGGFEIVEAFSDLRLLGGGERPIPNLYGRPLSMLNELTTPLVLRRYEKGSVPFSNAGTPLQVDDDTSSLIAQEPAFIAGATVTYDRRLFYSEFCLPATRLAPHSDPKKFIKIPLPIYMPFDAPLIMTPLPIRVIHYYGSSSAEYSLSSKVVRSRRGGSDVS